MLTKPRRIVFIGHDASLSGAPVLLLQLLLLLKREPDISITLVIHRGGPLIDAYRQHFEVILLKPAGYGQERNPVKRMLGILRNRRQMLAFMRKVAACDLVFSNTIVNGRLLQKIARLKKPVVTYVHELQNVIDLYKRSGDAVYPGLESGVIAYPSLKVKETVLRSYDIAEGRLKRLSYYFPFNPHQQQGSAFARELRAQLGDAFIVGGMGVACSRKGTDLFIEACAAVTRVQPEIKFCWTGVFETPEDEHRLKQLVKERGLESKLIFTGPAPHNLYNLAAFDLFFLSSREDPYPLVVLEAALVKVPAVCFEPSGGITEFVAGDAGWIVPGFSIEAAAAAILELYADRGQIRVKGERAQQKALQLHANPALVLQQFRSLLSLSGLD